MSTFGDIERTFADLYPYRWAIAAGVLALLAALTAFGVYRGWPQLVWQYRLPVAAVATPLLAVTIWLGWSLASPLFTNVTVDEEFPFAVNAVVPSGMARVEVEEIMAGLAKLSQELNDAMPGSMMAQNPGAGAFSGQVAETMTRDSTVKLKVGDFRDADGFHRGSGQATIYRGPDGSYLLRLEEFKVTNGPDLRVVLSPNQDPGNPGEVTAPGHVELGKLKGNIGNQNYEIPSDVDISSFQSVVIFCEPFKVIFSVASLMEVG